MIDRAIYQINRLAAKIAENSNVNFDCSYSYDKNSKNLMISVYENDKLLVDYVYNIISKKVYKRTSINNIVEYGPQELLDELKEYSNEWR